MFSNGCSIEISEYYILENTIKINQGFKSNEIFRTEPPQLNFSTSTTLQDIPRPTPISEYFKAQSYPIKTPSIREMTLKSTNPFVSASFARIHFI